MSENDDLTTLLILEEAENAPPVQRGGCLTLIIGIIGLSTAYLVITVVFLCLSLTPFVFAVISVYLVLVAHSVCVRSHLGLSTRAVRPS